MRHKSKHFILMLCVAAALCFLTACASQDTDSRYSIDPSLAGSISQVSESLLEEISSFDREDAPYLEDELRHERQDVLADGVADWANVQSDTGAFVRPISSEVVMEDDDTYICTIYAEFEQRNVEFKIYYEYTYENQSLLPSNITFNPEYTFVEKMQKGFLNMILGMGLVFVILIFLSLLISCFRFINLAQDRIRVKSRIPEGTGGSDVHADTSVVRRVRVPAAKKKSAREEPAAEPEPAVEEEYVDDLELVAVITAAIAAFENTSADGLKVRSIRRAVRPKWKNS